jgi:glycosyltransferase involved in cell wall biosynthesis
MKICFLFTANGLSGGNYVCYKHAKYLISCGHEVDLIFQSYDENNAHQFDISDIKIHKSFESARYEKYDLGIATFWTTAFKILELNCQQFAYFVQSDERRFYDEYESAVERANRYAVEYTYKYFPGHIITIAKWLQLLLKNEFGRDSSYSPNGVDLTIFNRSVIPVVPLPRKKIRVLVEGPGNVSFKRVEFVYGALNQFSDDFEIWHIANDAVIRPYWQMDRVFSRVPYKSMPGIMRSCDLLIKLSTVEGFFGPPLEMFACGGTALTSNVTGYDEYIEDGRNAMVAKMDDYNHVVANIIKIRDGGRKGLAKYKKNATLTAEKHCWSNQSPKFLEAINSAIQFDKSTHDARLLRHIGMAYTQNALEFLRIYA